jgi:hypothetical protein
VVENNNALQPTKALARSAVPGDNGLFEVSYQASDNLKLSLNNRRMFALSFAIMSNMTVNVEKVKGGFLNSTFSFRF